MALSGVKYSNTQMPAPTKGLKPVTSPYGAYTQLNPQAASPAASYAALNPPAPAPDVISRTIASGQNTTTGAAPKAAPPAKPPAAPSPPPGGGGGAFDLSTDPIVARIQALNANNYGQAVASADAQRKQALIAGGFGDVARATQFGSLEAPTTGDEATALAAQQNPFSTAANLLHAHQVADQGIDQTDNGQNLFYSSARANHIGDEATNYLGNESAAEDALRTTLAGILQNLVGVKTQGDTDLTNGIETARQNAITNAIASGEKFEGYDASGNPIFGAASTGGGGSSAAPPAANSPTSPAALYQLLNPPAAAPTKAATSGTGGAGGYFQLNPISSAIKKTAKAS